MNTKDNIFLRVAALVRCSHQEQKLHGYTIEHQVKALKKYAKENGMIIGKWYIDEAKSASKDQRKRTAFQELLQDVKNDKIDFIIFTKLDRYFRDVRSFYRNEDLFEKHKVRWTCTEEKFDNYTKEGKEMLGFKVLFAQMESDRIGERIDFTFKNMVDEKRPITGAQPFGYKIVGEEREKRIVKDEGVEDIVNDIFDHYEMYRNKRRTTRFIAEKYDVALSYKLISRILKNRCYTGEYRGVEDYYPAYISKERFEQIQKSIKNNVKATKENTVYMFSGIIRCGECGCRAAGTSSKAPSGKRYKLYRCGRFNNIKDCQNKRSVTELQIEKYLLDNIKDELEKHIIRAKVAEAEKKKPSVNKASIKAKIGRVRQMYKDGFMEYEDFKNDMTELNDALKRAEAEEKQNETRDLTPIKELLEAGFTEMYETLSDSEKSVFWSKIIREIKYYPDKKIEVFF